MELTVSVVSYRTPELLRQCLAALEREALELEVFVVDNASGDGSVDMVRAEFPSANVIENTRNVGFGAAHNQALRRAHGRYWVVLNSDAVPQPGALDTLKRELDDDPEIAVVGPKLTFPDGTVQQSRRRFPKMNTLFAESTQLQRFWPDNAALRRYYVQDRSDDEPQDVDWLVGACLCVRGAAAKSVGLFDERFFMYSDELDWCRRFRAAGWRVRYIPSAVVVHVEGASSRRDLAARDQRFQASKLAYARKWHGPLVAETLRAYLIGEYALRAVEEGAKLALGSRVPERRARLRVIGSGLKHALGL